MEQRRTDTVMLVSLSRARGPLTWAMCRRDPVSDHTTLFSVADCCRRLHLAAVTRSPEMIGRSRQRQVTAGTDHEGRAACRAVPAAYGIRAQQQQRSTIVS